MCSIKKYSEIFSKIHKTTGWDLQLYEKETLEKVLFCEFCEFLRTTFSQNTSG